MNINISSTLAHLIIGLATIGSLSALAATHVVNGSEALTMITGIAGVLLGTSATTMGASSANKTSAAAIADTSNMIVPPSYNPPIV